MDMRTVEEQILSISCRVLQRVAEGFSAVRCCSGGECAPPARSSAVAVSTLAGCRLGFVMSLPSPHFVTHGLVVREMTTRASSLRF